MSPPFVDIPRPPWIDEYGDVDENHPLYDDQVTCDWFAAYVPEDYEDRHLHRFGCSGGLHGEGHLHQ